MPWLNGQNFVTSCGFDQVCAPSVEWAHRIESSSLLSLKRSQQASASWPKLRVAMLTPWLISTLSVSFEPVHVKPASSEYEQLMRVPSLLSLPTKTA